MVIRQLLLRLFALSLVKDLHESDEDVEEVLRDFFSELLVGRESSNYSKTEGYEIDIV